MKAIYNSNNDAIIPLELIKPENWKNIPFPIIDAIKALIDS